MIIRRKKILVMVLNGSRGEHYNPLQQSRRRFTVALSNTHRWLRIPLLCAVRQEREVTKGLHAAVTRAAEAIIYNGAGEPVLCRVGGSTESYPSRGHGIQHSPRSGRLGKCVFIV